jgi:hypothetical protein
MCLPDATMQFGTSLLNRAQKEKGYKIFIENRLWGTVCDCLSPAARVLKRGPAFFFPDPYA